MPEITSEQLHDVRDSLTKIRNGLGNARTLAQDALGILDMVATTVASEAVAVSATSTVTPTAVAATEKSADKAGPEKSPAAERADFATSMVGIGASIVKAQQALDTASLDYCRVGRKDAKAVMPTLYRIPKVTACLKFALESIKGRDVNLLFYKNTNEQKELHQQTLELDIVAVPPPPEFIDYLARQLPQLRWVLGLAERAEITSQLEGWAAIVPGQGEKLLRHVVLLELPVLSDLKPVHPCLALLAYEASPTAHYVAAARLVPGAGEPDTLVQPKSIDPSDTGLDANMRRLLFDMVKPWATAQHELLPAAAS